MKNLLKAVAVVVFLCSLSQPTQAAALNCPLYNDCAPVYSTCGNNNLACIFYSTSWPGMEECFDFCHSGFCSTVFDMYLCADETYVCVCEHE